MNEYLLSILSILSIVTPIVSSILPVIYKYFNKRNETRKWRENEIDCKLIPNLDTHRERLKVINSSCFIPICGQSQSPSNSDNLEASKDRFPIVDMFLKDIFVPNNKVGKKRYIILGGSGTGKSILSVSLFEQYINRYNEKTIPFPIYVFYLGQNDIIDKIKEISKNPVACKSILILDALDENLEAIKDTSSFLYKLNAVTDNFKFVIITSRTQLFDNEDDELNESPILDPTLVNLKYERIYISPFDNEEIIKYLSNKYQIGTSEYSKAKQIVDKAYNVMSRPMLLSFIDDLLGMAHTTTISTVGIYKRIIDEWLKRECRTEHAKNCNMGVEALYNFSIDLAVFMYNKWIKNGTPCISIDEYDEFRRAYGYISNPYSFRGRSLINRRGDDYKFSHKSFWEFFIALDVLKNPGKAYNPNNFDMSKRFVEEFNELYLLGTRFNGVDYYERSYYKFTTENINSLIKLIPNTQICDDSSFHKEDYLQWAYSFWLELEQCLVSLYLLVDDSFQMVQPNYLHLIDHVITRIDLNKVVHSLQKCFYSNAFDYIKDLECLRDILLNRKKRLENNTNLDSYYPIIKNEVVVFPNLFTLKDKIVEKILATNIVCVGAGFYRDTSVFVLVNKLICMTPAVNIIQIVREYDNLEGATSFICELIESITVNNLKNVIIIQIKVVDVQMIYVINNQTIKTSRDNIIKYLSYMYDKKIGC